jgi:hypothetical protein
MAFQQEEESMTTPTDDHRDLLTIVAYMKAAPGRMNST